MLFRSKVREDDIYEFLQKNQEKFYRVAYSYTRNKEDALDVIQDSVYKALINVKTLKDKRLLKTWFYRILINTSIDKIRNVKNEFVLFDEENDSLSKDEINVDVIDLYDALDKLDEHQRIVIILRYFEDMKIEEISVILGCPKSTIKSRIYAGLKSLKVKMEGDGNE